MIHIRPAVSDDAPALLDIYAPYVIETAITFEYEVPTLDDFRQRIKNTLHTHPYLVIERDGEIAGYAYTGQLGSRAAYAWAAETSIYLRQDCRRGGLGTRLYHALEDASRAQNVQVLYACIAAPVSDGDPHLTRAALISIPGAATKSWAPSTAADTSLTPGTTWSGWKNACPMPPFRPPWYPFLLL